MGTKMIIKRLFYTAVIITALTGCVGNPVEAFKLSATNLQDRQMQSRTYRNIKEENILAASAAVFQDMGYTLSESETRLGVITATKDADATDGTQVALAIFAALLGGGQAAIDDKQRFTTTIVVLPRGNTNVHTVRMTMQRVVWNTHGNVSKLETIKSEEVYKTFFEKLSKAVFLEKNI